MPDEPEKVPAADVDAEAGENATPAEAESDESSDTGGDAE